LEQHSYDRRLLLLGPKRNALLELEEVQRYGRDSYGDPNYVSLYGRTPAEWYADGVRLLGRTAVECTPDQLASAMAQDIAAHVTSTPITIVDPFVGSANTLYWILRHLPGARALGFELDPRVFELTRQNLSLLNSPIELHQADYRDSLGSVDLPVDHQLVAFIAPPWGTALSPTDGLDLGATQPPIAEVLDVFRQRFPNPTLFAVQVFETLVSESLRALTESYQTVELRTYPFNAPGQRHGLLLLREI
jgi:hypothetical protein